MDVLSVVLGSTGTVSSLGTVAYWLFTRRLGLRQVKHEETDARIHAAIVPLHTELTELHVKFDAFTEGRSDSIKVALHDALEPVRDQLSILNTKVEPLWTALINMGINQVNVLHQPDPRRAEIDGLLEALQEELRGGPRMAASDYIKLRGFLKQIKEWEPGQELDFPVLPAEPTSAAILLSIMGLSRIRRRQGG